MEDKTKVTEPIIALLGFAAMVGIVTLDVPQMNDIAENVAAVVFGAVAVIDSVKRLIGGFRE